MKKLLIPIMFLCSIYGCYVAITMIPLTPEPKVGKSYQLSETYNVTTGESLIRLENLRVWRTYTPAFEYQYPSAFIDNITTSKRLKLLPGQKWMATYITGAGGLILMNPEYSTNIGIHVLPNLIVGKGWVRVSSGNVIPIQDSWIKKPLFTQIDGVTDKGPFACELIYSGISGSTIRLLYREYKDDMARSAFYQDLTYDLKESNLIVFRSLKIEILEANSSLMTFKIISDDDNPWFPKESAYK